MRFPEPSASGGLGSGIEGSRRRTMRSSSLPIPPLVPFPSEYAIHRPFSVIPAFAGIQAGWDMAEIHGNSTRSSAYTVDDQPTQPAQCRNLAPCGPGDSRGPIRTRLTSISGHPIGTFTVHKRHEILRYSWLVGLKPARSRTTPFVRGAIVLEEDPLSPPSASDSRREAR